ncbi:hypothetical protein [Thiorhodovibrio frisius]|uniref:Uncharacterized protein n=1 Tax=Thiorhodovibrio frisius TaxID=631362 RepID=H8Z755_9GAMM|nr:hypothetical protein [Thiorhodovibrio frisius]EIC20854.1 hypothetical protein Thi970DRAFT_04521 [Thiorhodovibrio frisius]WPL21907.1 hypothetical protein Thiofri_02046 [Thiorhodovibrio frisius]
MSELAIGETVTHKARREFGVGKIFKVYDNGKVAVEFPDSSTKTLIYKDKPYTTFTYISRDCLVPAGSSNSRQLKKAKGAKQTSSMKQSYLDYYIPLVAKFCSQLKMGQFDDLERLSQPFLPLFGDSYEHSQQKLLIIGQDTYQWFPADQFIAGELAEPGSGINKAFENVIQGYQFRDWGRNTHSFLGFVMGLLGSVNEIDDWTILKRGSGYEKVLGSFAWGNSNAIEVWATIEKYKEQGLPHPSQETWEAAREASKHFNKLEHMLLTLKPKTVLILNSGLEIEDFFAGLDFEGLGKIGERFLRYRVRNFDVDVYHTCHPSYMRNRGGPLGFIREFHDILEEKNSVRIEVSTLLQSEAEKAKSEDEALLDFIREHAPSAEKADKYELVAWVAATLIKHDAFMVVPTLAEILNDKGFKTDYDTEYSGGRGTYRLVSSTYIRLEKDGAIDEARYVAEAFRKPDLTYAYCSDDESAESEFN